MPVKYDNCIKTSATLVIRGDNFCPKIFTKEVGFDPGWAHSVGDPWKLRNASLKREEGLWGIESTGNFIPSDPTDPEEHVNWLVKKFENKEDILSSYINDEDIYVGTWVWWECLDSGGTYFLSNSSLQALSKLCDSVNFTFLAKCE